MLFFLLFTLTAHAASATDPAWRALLHFHGASGGSSSAHEGAPFFLSPEGHLDPAAELAATEAYFRANPGEAACRFPARAIYLGLTNEGHTELCGRWQRWRQAIHAKGAELVFAASYLSSPSAMYGHTLMKFNRAGQSEGEDLLDYTLSYGAKTGDVGGLAYVWRGLTGGFAGSYVTSPFYMKVKEYNFVENRDFWIYPVILDEAELRIIVAHAWELREVDFPYYFLHRNCAYFLLELLEVAHPGADFTGHFALWTVPADTIRLLQKSHAIGEPRFRASRYRRLHSAREALLPGEASVAEAWANPGEPPALPAGREAPVLDAAYELWRYRADEKPPGDAAVERRLLLARGRLNAPAPGMQFPNVVPPERGHPTQRASVGYGLNRDHGFAEIQYRGTLHDALADPRGYEDYSELAFGDLRARVEDGKIFLERFDLLRIRSLAPRETWVPRAAWSFAAGFTRAKEFRCQAWDCSAGQLEGGYGQAVHVGPAVVFALAGLGFEAGKPFDRGYRLGAGPAGGVFLPIASQTRLLVSGDWRWRLLGSQVPKRSASLGASQTFGHAWEARVSLEVDRGYREGTLGAFYYF